MDKISKVSALLLVTLSLMSLALLPSITVKAQTRTLTVPDQYPTITSAIANAADGDTIFVRAGTYEGPINTTLVINKSITIIGENAQNTIINLYPAYNVTWIFTTPQYTYTNAVAITANSCVIENLTLNVKTGGYIAAQGNNIQITNNKILTGYDTGITISGSNCTVNHNNMDGMIRVYGSYNQVDSNNPNGIYLGNVTGNGASFNIIENNNCQAIGLYYSTNNVILNNNASGYGIEIEWSNNNFLHMNRASSNWSHAVRFWLSSNNTFELNSLTYVTTSAELIELSGSYNNLFSLNNFIDHPNNNGSYVYDDFRDPNSHIYVSNYSTNIWSQNSLGNYWGNYLTKYPNAIEVGNSGVGNQPYVINYNNTDAYPLMPNHNISTASIKLPNWTNLTLPTITIQTPAFPSPQPSASVMPTNNPTTDPTQAPTPATTPIQTSAPTPTYATPESTATLDIPRNAPHLDLIDYLVPVSAILAVVVVAVLLYRRHRKQRGSPHE